MAVERFKHDGEWKIIGSSSGKVQVADDKLDPESINSVQNKVITKALENKADIVDKLVNAYGIRSVSNTEYYMPDIGGVNPAHSLATKADIINSGTGGSGGGLELRELKMSGSADDNAYNLETLELMKENKVLPAVSAGNGILVPVTYNSGGEFIVRVVVQKGIEAQMTLTMAEDGSFEIYDDISAPYVLTSPSRVLEWLTKNDVLASLNSFESAFVFYEGQFCLIDYYKATTGDATKKAVQFNYGSQRFERVYNATTGEEISTTEIPLGGGESVEVVDNLESESTTAALSANQGRVLSEKIDSEKENIINNIVSNEEVIASAFNNIHIVIRDIKESISNNVTKEELQYEIEDLRSKIIANEAVIANALSDLNTKFLDLESRLIDVEKITEQ
jgi:hypothetical protein